MVMDPPWENASAQRSSQYPTLPSRNLLRIPMKRLLHQVLPMPWNPAHVCVEAHNRQLKISLPKCSGSSSSTLVQHSDNC